MLRCRTTTTEATGATNENNECVGAPKISQIASDNCVLEAALAAVSVANGAVFMNAKLPGSYGPLLKNVAPQKREEAEALIMDMEKSGTPRDQIQRALKASNEACPL